MNNCNPYMYLLLFHYSRRCWCLWFWFLLFSSNGFLLFFDDYIAHLGGSLFIYVCLCMCITKSHIIKRYYWATSNTLKLKAPQSNVRIKRLSLNWDNKWFLHSKGVTCITLCAITYVIASLNENCVRNTCNMYALTRSIREFIIKKRHDI